MTLHRIPFGIKSPPSYEKPAVLVQHGHLTNSAESLSSGPENSLGINIQTFDFSEQNIAFLHPSILSCMNYPSSSNLISIFKLFLPTGHYLADVGYDVWLGNTRGTRYSNKHVRFDTDERKYWDFSWADMGYYDLPAMIDHILAVTKQEQLFYIGYSKGTTMFFVMCATRPEYNDKIRLMSALAPMSYMSHVSSPVIMFLKTIWRSLKVNVFFIF